MDWFDCNCGFGIPAKPLGGVLRSTSDLIDELSFCGVGEALVYHVAMEAESAQVGNRLVREETADEPRLHPTWAVLPPQTEELGTVDEFLAGMRQHDIKVLRAYPEEHRYRLDALTFGPLLEELVPRRIPLMIGPHWQVIADLLADFQELTIIIHDHGDWGDDRYFRPLVERYPKVHLDTSNYQQAEGISDFVRRYGPDRLLYGSGAPTLQMGAALLSLAGADVSAADKEAIVGGNLRRLLSEVQL